MTTKVTRTTTTCAAGPAMRTARVGLNKRNGLRQRGSTIRVNSQKDTFPRDWLKKDNFPLYVGFLAWTIPSSIPVGSFGGSSLFYRLNESIAEGFAKFPTGPGVNDPFWVYMLTWHIGLFLTLTLAKIGYEGKKEGYFGDDA
ncbi:subunit O of photosystem I [Chloropicon roscoffensis]|uniref:Subunit O of photosystem I n=1 Tax=Chloropicon roscoffensis TaxID=1461544 RepID=A0AAX4P8N3_9CHLO